MEKIWRWLALNLGKQAGAVSAIGLIVTAVLGFGLTKLEFATDQDSYLNTDDQVYIDNVDYQGTFGGQAMLTVVELDDGLSLSEFLTPEVQAEFDRAAETLVAEEGIKGVISPVTALTFSQNLLTMNMEGQPAATPFEAIATLTTQDAINNEAEGTPERAAREADLAVTAERLLAAGEQDLSNQAWREFIIFGNDGEIRPAQSTFMPADNLVLMITRLEGNQSIESEGEMADLVVETAAGMSLPGGMVTSVGAPSLLKDINDYLRGGIFSLGAVAFGMMVLILVFLFDVRWRLLPLLVVAVGVIWAFGLAGYLGIPLSLVTISGLPVMLGVGIDYAIQLHSRVEEEVLLGRSDHPIQETAINLGPALLVVTFDAVFAFAALRFAKVPMIRDFGLLLAIGIAAICLCSIITPLALLGMREFRSPTKGRTFNEGLLGKIVVKMGSLPAAMAVPFAVASIAIFVGGLAVESRLNIQADPIDWVDQSSETITKIDYLQDRLGTSSELGVFVRDEDVFDQETVDFVDGFIRTQIADRTFVNSDTGEESPAFLNANSIVQVMANLIKIDGASPLPPGAEFVEAAWNVAPPGIQASTATPGGDAMNVVFLVGYRSLDDGAVVVEEIAETINPPEGTSVTPSGLAVVGVGLLENIESNRILLTYLAIGFVGIFLIVRLKSLIRGVLSLVPVLIATGTASLVAFAFDLQLSPMTAVGGPLVVAICTEFTSLMLLRFVEERDRGLDPQAAADTAAARTGRAFIVSALTGVAGVAVIGSSSLPLLRGFGLIVAMNVAVALLSALIVLPPMLVWADDAKRGWVTRGMLKNTTGPRHDEQEIDLTEPPLTSDPVDSGQSRTTSS